jgi:uncharacterized iron-regulated protein
VAPLSDEEVRALTEPLLSSLKGAEVILVGETHDHPHHHALQAELIRRLAPRSVAFEMLNASQAAVAAGLLTTPSEGWGEALEWEARGWPPFELYRPIFEAARGVGAQLVAAHPDRATLQPLLTGEALPGALVDALKLNEPLPAEERAAQEAEIVAAHCGHAPPSLIGPMAQAQRLKDAWMARALLAAPRPVLMIVGRGHTQPRRGIPWALERLSAPQPAPRWAVVALSVDPEARAGGEGVSQGVVRVIPTRPHREDDPCERFREQLKRMGRGAHAGPTPPP